MITAQSEWIVFLDGNFLDRVYFALGMREEEVMRSLIYDYGFHPDITVKKGYLKL